VWDRVTGYQIDPSNAIVVLTGLGALLAVSLDRVWRPARTVITIVHEAGHALVALATGRRLTSITLHSDTSGLTVSVGPTAGPGMVATLGAGYLAPSLLGLVGVAVLAGGLVTIALWVAAVLLVLMLTMVRNWYGAAAVLLTAAALGLIAWYAPAQVQAAFGHAATWFLLIGGVRPVGELQRQRRRGYAGYSDADQIGRLTGTPGWLWVGLFGLVTLAALGAGGWLLLR
jgi:Peptidase M50B-like